MKRFGIAIFTVLYIATSSGVPLYFHYCMGKPASWGLGQAKSQTCGKCGMNERGIKDGCCDDKHSFIKNDKDQKGAEIYYQSVPAIVIAYIPKAVESYSSVVPSVAEDRSLINAPPRRSGIAVYIFKRTFLI